MDRLTRSATAAGAAAVVYTGILRPWHQHWGATAAETSERLPGDEVVPQPEIEATHAITIQAPVPGVWPWLVQMGQNRGGFYSYSWLENLVGCHLQNADRIHPEWQDLKVGDVVWLHPKAPPLPVVVMEPYRAIVLGIPESENGFASPTTGTWGFYLKEVAPTPHACSAGSAIPGRPGCGPGSTITSCSSLHTS